MQTQVISSPQARPRPKTVLVIDDERVTLLMLGLMIKNAGYRVVTAGDGSEALKAIRLERPALVVADVALDGEASGQALDGFQVLEWMHRAYPEHRGEAIIVSAGDPEKLRRKAVEAGVSGFVPKPITKSLLLAEIKRAIGEPLDLPRHGETAFFRRHVPLSPSDPP